MQVLQTHWFLGDDNIYRKFTDSDEAPASSDDGNLKRCIWTHTRENRFNGDFLESAKRPLCSALLHVMLATSTSKASASKLNDSPPKWPRFHGCSRPPRSQTGVH